MVGGQGENDESLTKTGADDLHETDDFVCRDFKMDPVKR